MPPHTVNFDLDPSPTTPLSETTAAMFERTLDQFPQPPWAAAAIVRAAPIVLIGASALVVIGAVVLVVRQFIA